jgi:superfamily II DNA/RNA helicase
MFSVVCVGGTGIGPQMRGLRQRNDFIIGTPGRLKDLIDRRALNPAHINTIVLDEADRMLDMGFIDDMRYVMQRMPTIRHTLFFSATMSPDIEKVVDDFLHDPKHVSVKTRDTSKNVDQDVVHIKATEQKVDVLHEILMRAGFEKVLVFGRTKHGVEKLAKTLERRGIDAESIHGNKSHGQRVRALNSFKAGHSQVLVATDVAARGLDIPSVSHVINYDVPTTYEDYIHRIGRTGRADKTGSALTFIGGGKKVVMTPGSSERTQAGPSHRRQAQSRPAKGRRPRRRVHGGGEGRVRRLA